MIDIAAEFGFLTGYAVESCFDEEICRDHLRMLWTAFCLYHGLEPTPTTEWADFNGFENFMCKHLV